MLSENRRKEEPKDKGNIAYYIFLLFGIGGLLPWNAIITAIYFFSEAFPSHDPAFDFTLILNSLNFIFNFVNMFTIRLIPLKFRLVVSLLAIFGLLWSMPFISNYLSESKGWLSIIIIIVAMGVANSFAQVGIYGFAGVFPPKYTGAVMIGNGLSGLSMNIFRMSTLVAFPPKEIEEGETDNTAFIGCIIYFAITSLILIMSIFGYFYISNTEFAQFYMKRVGDTMSERTMSLNIAARSAGSLGHADAIKIFHEEENIYIKMEENDHINNESESTSTEKAFLQIYKNIGFMAIQVFICFTITFVVFPGTLLSTRFGFLGESPLDKAWLSVLIITLFNFFDIIGKFTAGLAKILSPRTIFILTVFRIVFIPTSIFIKLGYHPTWIFTSDWFRILNIALFSFTNGYSSVLLMTYGPQLVDNNSKERAIILMSFHLVGGIFFGSLIASFGIKEIN